MHYQSAWIGVFFAGLLGCAAAGGAEDDSAVLPFLDDNTIVVARVDEAGLDVKAAAKALIASFESSRIDPQVVAVATKAIAEPVSAMEKWTDQFRAAGGKRLYVVLGMADLPDPGPFIVVPLGPGANAKALGEIFKGNGREHAETIGAALVWGNDETLKRLKGAPAGKPRPEFAAAMAAAGNAPARVVLIPSDSLRQLLEKAMPNFPDAMGGWPVTTLSQGVKWATLSVNPQKLSFDLIVQARDVQTASELLKLEEKFADWAAEQAKTETFDVKKALAPIRPNLEIDRLHIAPNSGQIDHLIAVALPIIIDAREDAATMASGVNIQILLQASIGYSFDHGGNWPDALDQVEKYVGTKEQLKELMSAPPRGGATPHYIYCRPAHPKTKPTETVAIYESFPEGSAVKRVNVGFVDGHVESLTPADLKTRLEAAK